MKTIGQALGLLVILIVGYVAFMMTTTPPQAKHAAAQPPMSQDANMTARVTGKPTISAQQIDTILCTFSSPACHKGQTLYDLGVKYNIDSAYALAFFLHESHFGTQGEARTTFSLGNLRCINDRPCVDRDRGGYAQFYSWEDGFQHWFALIRELYINTWHRETVAAILEKYAPAGDGNDPTSYANNVMHAVAVWRSGKVAL